MRRVALRLPPGPAPAWVDEVMRAAQSAAGVELVGVFEAAGSEDANRRSPWQRLYSRLDRRLFDRGEDDALRPGDGIADALPKLETAADVDLVVDLTLGPRSEANDVPGRATWEVRLGAADGSATLASVFAAASPCYSASLWARERGEADARLTAISVGRLDQVSPHRNLSRACWRVAALVERQLSTPDTEDAHPTLTALEGGRGRMRAMPGPARMLRRLARRVVESRLERERWSIHLRRSGEGMPSGGEGEAVLAPPAGRFYADPFLLETGGGLHLLFEEYLEEERRGVISTASLDDSGRPGEVHRVLDAPDHLSYPFVFEHGGELYMLPESAASGRVDLYRATRPPHEWKREATLLDGIAAYDPTLLAHDGRFWLWLATIPRGGIDADELRLFSAPELHGPYEPHPLNPLLSDVRCARPAGAILDLGGELLRPAQDGSRGYGSAVRWRRIERLDREGYRESDAGALAPPPGGRFAGLHTFNRRAGWEAWDLLERPRRWPRPRGARA